MNFRNIAEFYGAGFSTGNLELLARFYDKYPEYVDKTFLTIKVSVECKTQRRVTGIYVFRQGGMKANTMMTDNSYVTS